LTAMVFSLRIIKDDALPATFNMAADRYLLNRAAENGTVSLRIYSWNPPAISLGCMENAAATLDKDALSRSRVEWISRPTGGRAVLHWNDVTYSCVFPEKADVFGGTISESYAVISRCLMASLALAGIPCESHASAAEYAETKREIKLPCFLSPNRSEIMVQGKKLAGSAKKRTPYGVLQHGSIPLDGSFRRLPDFLAITPDERTRLRGLLDKKCICVNEINPAVDYNKLSACIIIGFTETLNFSAFEKPWGENELDEIYSTVAGCSK
jgi:lipoyl(octanoyl) transferase